MTGINKSDHAKNVTSRICVLCIDCSMCIIISAALGAANRTKKFKPSPATKEGEVPDLVTHSHLPFHDSPCFSTGGDQF